MTLAVFQTTVQNAAGDAIPSAQVTVRLGSSSGALANLFIDNAGATPITNPFNADTNGFARFFATPGVYWISITGGGSTQVLERVVLAGTAATANTTTSTTDTTLGRVMLVGDYGHGLPFVATDNDMLAGSYQIPGLSGLSANGGENFPLTAPSRFIFTVDGSAGSGLVLTAVLRSVLPRDFFRVRTGPGEQSPWIERYNKLNLLHLRNTSGGTINSNATVAGSGLTPAQTGTWRNVAGVNITANGFGFFMRVV